MRLPMLTVCWHSRRLERWLLAQSIAKSRNSIAPLVGRMEATACTELTSTEPRNHITRGGIPAMAEGGIGRS